MNLTDVFQADREAVLRHDLRHCDRDQLETLLISICVAHDLFDEINVLRHKLPRSLPHEQPDDAPDLAAADALIAREEQRLDEPPP